MNVVRFAGCSHELKQNWPDDGAPSLEFILWAPWLSVRSFMSFYSCQDILQKNKSANLVVLLDLKVRDYQTP